LVSETKKGVRSEPNSLMLLVVSTGLEPVTPAV
jgi:hypothetical protein